MEPDLLGVIRQALAKLPDPTMVKALEYRCRELPEHRSHELRESIERIRQARAILEGAVAGAEESR